jgi:beta-lactamase regulating signal transducer with metallopeptidase domain
LALTFGLQRPTIMLSRWMVEALDSKELESVLAHEVGHVSRGDFLATWMATILRDAFFYLPTSAAAYRQFQYERELACDDLALRATGRPLALASALAKVWQHGLSGSLPQPVQALAGPDDAIEQRIQRLLAPSATNPSPRQRRVFCSLGLQSLSGLAALLVANALVMLVPMGCGPGSLI